MHKYLIIVNQETYILQEADHPTEALEECRRNWPVDIAIISMVVLARFGDLDGDTFTIGNRP